jgi:hypothetical protein
MQPLGFRPRGICTKKAHGCSRRSSHFMTTPGVTSVPADRLEAVGRNVEHESVLDWLVRVRCSGWGRAATA